MSRGACECEFKASLEASPSFSSAEFSSMAVSQNLVNVLPSRQHVWSLQKVLRHIWPGIAAFSQKQTKHYACM